MSITVNDGGVLRKLGTVTVNDGGVLQNIFSAKKITWSGTAVGYITKISSNGLSVTVSGANLSDYISTEIVLTKTQTLKLYKRVTAVKNDNWTLASIIVSVYSGSTRLLYNYDENTKDFGLYMNLSLEAGTYRIVATPGNYRVNEWIFSISDFE